MVVLKEALILNPVEENTTNFKIILTTISLIQIVIKLVTDC